MPTVLRVHGFRFVIRLPPREHPPPHVQVFVDGGSVTIALPMGDDEPNVRGAVSVRDDVAWRAVRLTKHHAAYLLARWKDIHDA
ncbi:MAG: hypothetical protein C0503_11910 [Gemmatimonas sp.]|nr:hypothetical protein [Gemmatimonas sp.]